MKVKQERKERALEREKSKNNKAQMSRIIKVTEDPEWGCGPLVNHLNNNF